MIRKGTNMSTKSTAQKKRSLYEWLKGYTGQKYMITILFLLIPLVLLILFTLIPAFNMMIYSFQKRDQMGVTVEWIGLENYVRLFTDDSYLKTFKNSIYYFIGSFVQMSLGLFIAVLLCSKIKFSNVFKDEIDETMYQNIRLVVQYYDASKVFDNTSMIKHLIATKIIKIDMSSILDLKQLTKDFGGLLTFDSYIHIQKMLNGGV
jgi:ABC-type polysaccharide transport system permease subunit